MESDFKALKLIHGCVVDTSVLYPHKMGPPMKRALKTLCIEHLKRIIQEDGKFGYEKFLGITNFTIVILLFVIFAIAEAGHNSAEDAEVCIELMKHYLKNRTV